MLRWNGCAASLDNVAALDIAGIDRKALAAKAVGCSTNRCSRQLFHADAHAAIWVDPDPARAADPRFIALDFGIVGQLSPRDQYWLAENFMAIFRRDYRRIAELHVAAGWMPPHIRVEELEAAARAVCEPYFTRPLSEFSLGEVLLKLFRTAQRHELTLQPQLILMQKTLFNIEGLAVCWIQPWTCGRSTAGAGTHPARALQPGAAAARIPPTPARADVQRTGHARLVQAGCNRSTAHMREPRPRSGRAGRPRN